jgi:glutamate--cysteine ligase
VTTARDAVVMPRLDRETLYNDLRDRVFPAATPGDIPPRIGAEVEIIPVDAESGRPIPLEAGAISTLDILRRAGEPLGWRERRSAKANVPEIELPDGGRLTFEPGGQIEISSAPNASVTGLVAQLREIVSAIRDAAPRNVRLLSVGVDPVTRVEDVTPQLDADRYRRMLQHFDRIGPSGAMMMRQTASIQVCVDAGPAAATTWRLLNALAPFMVSMFANSPRYAGVDTGFKSYRRHIWATLDPRRTGVLGFGADPVEEYLDFALDAPAFLLPEVNGASAPFGHWMARGGASESDWCTHLTTLFPEVRPRGYFELRSADVVAPEWYAVPLVLVSGLVYHQPTLEAASELIVPDRDLLARSARCGLTDPTLGATSVALCDMALAGASALGEAFVAGSDIAVAAKYFDRYTRRGRSPADEAFASDS